MHVFLLTLLSMKLDDKKNLNTNRSISEQTAVEIHVFPRIVLSSAKPLLVKSSIVKHALDSILSINLSQCLTWEDQIHIYKKVCVDQVFHYFYWINDDPIKPRSNLIQHCIFLHRFLKTFKSLLSNLS